MESDGSPHRPVTTVESAFEIVEAIKSNGDLTVTEIAAELECAKSTVHRHLATLESMGYVVKNGARYDVGLRFLDLGIHARDRRTLYHVAKPKLEAIAAETGEKTWCVVEEAGRGIHLFGVRGKHPVKTFARTGQRTYLHQHAAGKAILAALPIRRVEAIVDRYGLPALTENTITSRDALFDELERIVDRGYAVNREESVDGLHAIGASICDGDDVVGAVSISGPANRLRGEYFEAELPELLLGATNEIEINLHYS